MLKISRDKQASPKIPRLPPAETLFVTKQIATYAPNAQPATQAFVPQPDQVPKKHFPSVPKSHSEVRDCTAALSGEQLQKIQAGPVTIKFGQIFIKSTIQQTFWVRNDLDRCVAVQLDAGAVRQLEKSYLQTQVVPAGGLAGFQVVFQSSEIETFKGFLKYKVLITSADQRQARLLHPGGGASGARAADIQQDGDKVQLHGGQRTVFTQIEMETTETLKVQNTGNAKAFYRWVKGPESQNLFRIQPENGSIEPNSAFDFSIIYSPNAQSAGKLDDDRMIMKVSNASR